MSANGGEWKPPTSATSLKGACDDARGGLGDDVKLKGSRHSRLRAGTMLALTLAPALTAMVI